MMNPPSVSGFRRSLSANLNAANNRLSKRPNDYWAQIRKMKALHSMELLTSYLERAEGDENVRTESSGDNDA